ncbi:hypothetical protein P389DRAFT_40017 [Cystobasidium minutum MCA 4210]|uniref:uncharacterized protein n=1 Tax=Cystobasidium minutum MCA 4210 TaxID=1397322 RepID=UPI0034D00CCA|eukprot:jgi/Rhomi1/40017/CE40016_101
MLQGYVESPKALPIVSSFQLSFICPVDIALAALLHLPFTAFHQLEQRTGKVEEERGRGYRHQAGLHQRAWMW